MRRGDMPEAVGDTLCVPIFFEIAFTFKRPLLSLRLVLPSVKREQHVHATLDNTKQTASKPMAWDDIRKDK